MRTLSKDATALTDALLEFMEQFVLHLYSSSTIRRRIFF
jgi:hypothetical protein